MNKNKLKWVLVGIVVALLVTSFRYWNIQGVLQDFLEKIQELGAVGALLFVGVYIVACVLFFPGSILTLGAGGIFGVVKGSVLVSISATLGATAAFLAGRYLARDWVTHKIEGNKKFRAIDEAVAKEGWKIVGLTRLSPVFPFNLLNYAYGLTKVSLRDYFWASWIGMIPGTILFVYIGSLAGDLASIGTQKQVRTPIEWVFYGAGLLATLAVTFYVTQVARKALKERIPK